MKKNINNPEYILTTLASRTGLGTGTGSTKIDSLTLPIAPRMAV